MTTKKRLPVSQLCCSCLQAMPMETCFLIPSLEADINFNFWLGHMLRSNTQTCFFILVNAVPAPILSENQTEAHKGNLFRKDQEKKEKHKDGHICQATKNICVDGGRCSLFSEKHCELWQSFTQRKSLWAITLSLSTTADKNQWRVYLVIKCTMIL